MPKGDGQMPLIATYGHMPLEQQMMPGTMPLLGKMMNVLSPDFAAQKEYQPLDTNTTLDAQSMSYKRKSRMERKQENGRTEQE
jgi:hypothetical protein